MSEKPEFQRLTFNKGAVVLEEGIHGDAVYMITSGKVEVRKGIRNDYPVLLGIRGAGEIIGEMAMIDGAPHMATVVAVEDTVVTAMSRDEFQKHLDSLTPIMRSTVKIILRGARELAEKFAQKHEPLRTKKRP
jgi:CRP-like cAMP-binding protein